ncbi:MAG: flavin reductase family protein [Acidimicrobiales bacterium]
MSEQPVPTKIAHPVSDLPEGMGYKLISSLIVPRPIGWIGTVSLDGVPNLAPYSFFNAVAGNPPTVVFSPGVGARKDTLDNVTATGEFTVNIVTEEVVEAMNATAASFDAEEDEFELCGLTPMASTLIGAPMVGECKATIECRVVQIVPIGDKADGNMLVIGEAVMFHVNDDLFDGSYIDQVALRAVGRHAGSVYSRSSDQFKIARPT